MMVVTISIISRLPVSWASEKGLSKYELRDKEGVILDYNKAINISPQYANPYANRGNARFDLGDSKGAIDDLEIAAQLFKAQNNQKLYNVTINLIQKFSNP
jgi:tetratricopeptide (TPR) repeat protein